MKPITLSLKLLFRKQGLFTQFILYVLCLLAWLLPLCSAQSLAYLYRDDAKAAYGQAKLVIHEVSKDNYLKMKADYPDWTFSTSHTLTAQSETLQDQTGRTISIEDVSDNYFEQWGITSSTPPQEGETYMSLSVAEQMGYVDTEAARAALEPFLVVKINGVTSHREQSSAYLDPGLVYQIRNDIPDVIEYVSIGFEDHNLEAIEQRLITQYGFHDNTFEYNYSYLTGAGINERGETTSLYAPIYLIFAALAGIFSLFIFHAVWKRALDKLAKVLERLDTLGVPMRKLSVLLSAIHTLLILIAFGAALGLSALWPQVLLAPLISGDSSAWIALGWLLLTILLCWLTLNRYLLAQGYRHVKDVTLSRKYRSVLVNTQHAPLSDRTHLWRWAQRNLATNSWTIWGNRLLIGTIGVMSVLMIYGVVHLTRLSETIIDERQRGVVALRYRGGDFDEAGEAETVERRRQIETSFGADTKITPLREIPITGRLDKQLLSEDYKRVLVDTGHVTLMMMRNPGIQSLRLPMMLQAVPDDLWSDLAGQNEDGALIVRRINSSFPRPFICRRMRLIR